MATILVVDDDPEAQNLFRTWLTKHHYDILTAETGAEAIRIVRSKRPDLILLDVMLPGMDGIEVCRRLRADEDTSHIPIILITAYDPAVSRVEALMAGATDYVTKPIALRDLLDRIRIPLADDRSFIDQSRRLLHETVHAALSIVPCSLAWLVTSDARRGLLIHKAAATTRGDSATRRFVWDVVGDGDGVAGPLSDDGGLMAHVALSGAGEFNLPLSRLREEGDEKLYRACERLDLYFISAVPLLIAGAPLGVMLIGSREPRDVETPRGQQLIATVASQAATVVHNAELMRELARREADTRLERAFRQTVLDTMTDGLLVYDATGHIKFANQRLSLMTGHHLEELEGRIVESLFAPGDQSRLASLVNTVPPMDTESFEVGLQRADGSSVPVLAVQAGYKTMRDQLGEDRVMVITNLSDQKARERALIRQTHRLRALNRATQAITSTLSFEDTIDAILNEASTVLDATIASVLMSVPGTDELTVRAVVGPGAEPLKGMRVSASSGIIGKAMQNARPEATADLTRGDRDPHPFSEQTGIEIRSVAAAPLFIDSRIVGVIEVVHVESGAFGPSDLQTLEGLAHSAAIAINNARLYGDAQRHVRELELLLKANETTSSTLSIEHVVESVARQLIEALDVNWCMVSSWEPESERIIQLAEVADVVWPPERGVVASPPDEAALRSLQEGQPYFTSPDQPDVGRLRRLPESSSVLRLPIRLDAHLVGMAEIYYVLEQGEMSAGDADRAHAAIVAWVRSLGADRDWKCPGSIRDLGARLLRITKGAHCLLYEYRQQEGVFIGLYESGRFVWPLGQGPDQELEDDDVRRVALYERTPIAARVAEGGHRLPQRTAFPTIDAGVVLIAPLIARGMAIGLVELVNLDTDRRFSETELSLAQAIGNVVGNALENARLYSALLRRAAQVEAAYNDLQEADRLKAEWVQNVSHELRTPLTSIIGYMDLLMAGDLGSMSEEQMEGLTVVRGKSQELSNLVEDILRVQRMEQEVLHREPVSIPQLVAQIGRSMQSEFEKAEVTLETDFPADLPTVPADVESIRQVLRNLLDNALKFSPGGERVTVRARDLGPAIQVDVIDQGIGIPASEHDKIWRRFYQVDGSMTRKYSGTGLGLAIVKEAVEKHGGRVWVESEPGGGSIFTFLLPRIDAM